ncbi:hypothetical protein [Streptomyces europaeiscabiei]|uniref:hypothetical protein n=1 Tax=Streptomyces europaeiscabiei TaxID=146819 RepID=UPI0038F66A00
MFIPAITDGARMFDGIETSFTPSFNSHNGGSYTIKFRVDDPQTPEVDFEARKVSALVATLAMEMFGARNGRDKRDVGPGILGWENGRAGVGSSPG